MKTHAEQAKYKHSVSVSCKLKTKRDFGRKSKSERVRVSAGRLTGVTLIPITYCQHPLLTWLTLSEHWPKKHIFVPMTQMSGDKSLSSWCVKCHSLNFNTVDKKCEKRSVCYCFPQGSTPPPPFWCALSMAQMDNPSLSEDTGTPAQSDRCDHIHHPDKGK